MAKKQGNRGSETMIKQDNAPIVLTVPQAAALLNISVRSAYTLCRRTDFPAVQLTPNRIGVSRVGLENWVAEQTQKHKVV